MGGECFLRPANARREHVGAPAARSTLNTDRVHAPLQPGASFSLRSRKPTAAVPAAPKAWTVSADDADEELMDEDDLLTEDDLRRPAPPASADDCEARDSRGVPLQTVGCLD